MLSFSKQMFRKIDYISVWVRSVLNSSWNCSSYSGQVCMVLCINFIACFIWCRFLPPSMEAAFPFFDSFCVVSTAVFWGDNLVGMEIIVTWWEFVILQNNLFSFIQFLSLESQFHFAMPHFCCFRFVLLQLPQWVCFYSHHGYDERLKFSF